MGELRWLRQNTANAKIVKAKAFTEKRR